LQSPTRLPPAYGDGTGPTETTLLNGVRQDFKFKKYLVIYFNLFAIFPFFLSIPRRELRISGLNLQIVETKIRVFMIKT